MTQSALDKFKKDFQRSIRTYFNNDSSESDAVYQIFLNTLNFYMLYKETDNFEEPESDPSIVDLEEDGIHLAHDYDSVFHSGMLESFDPVDRIRLMESCIYALNARLNIHISKYKQHRYGNKGDD
tara:strand:+ start:898 stop:1272 length:375 start_codon:yes stop_codon:yes gene_type:complete